MKAKDSLGVNRETQNTQRQKNLELPFLSVYRGGFLNPTEKALTIERLMLVCNYL